MPKPNKIISYIRENSSELIRQKRLCLNMTQKELADVILHFPTKAPFENNKNAKFTMIDLFAGIGGTRLGFHQTDQVKTVFTSEFDPFAQKTYRANFGEIPQGDITKIPIESIPNHDILVAGFPCQAFSQAGYKRGFEDTRGSLFFDIARILKAKRPKAFLLENVKNLKNHDKGNTYQTITQTLAELDYEVSDTILRARDFGVPQNRERIYIVGFDKKQMAKPTHFSFPSPTYIKTSVDSILEKSVNEKYTISDKLWDGHKRRKINNKKLGKGFGYSLFTKKSPYTNTISARYYKDGSEILIEQINNNPRKLTPREAARLQGFPEEYIIPVSDTQAYKQFGNSVCVPVINAIATEILKILD